MWIKVGWKVGKWGRQTVAQAPLQAGEFLEYFADIEKVSEQLNPQRPNPICVRNYHRSTEPRKYGWETIETRSRDQQWRRCIGKPSQATPPGQ